MTTQDIRAVLDAVLHELERGDASDYRDIVARSCQDGIDWCVRELRALRSRIDDPHRTTTSNEHRI